MKPAIRKRMKTTSILANPARNRLRLRQWLLTGTIFCGLAAFQPVWAQTQTYPRTWQQVFPSSNPPQSLDFAMAYDEARRVVVLFGGYNWDTSGYGSGTWTWDGQAWSLVTLFGPSQRESAKMVYDSERRVCVLFGGDTVDGLAVSETWEWGGTSWQLRTTNGPPPTLYHAMAYDKVRKRTVLYGGNPCPTCGNYPTHTWEWDGQQWLRVSTNGPPRRGNTAMAYDEARQRIVLFGGASTISTNWFNDTWTWDGIVWSQMPALGPGARADHAMTYDPDRGTVLLFGGQTQANDRDNSTWEWDGSQWLQHILSVSPVYRGNHGLAYDAARNEIVLYGGFSPFNPSLHDTWLLRLVETWVDFNYPGLPFFSETGALLSPYNTLAEGVNAAPAASFLSIKPGKGNEPITITKSLKLRAPLGPVTIGAP